MAYATGQDFGAPKRQISATCSEGILHPKGMTDHLHGRPIEPLIYVSNVKKILVFFSLTVVTFCYLLEFSFVSHELVRFAWDHVEDASRSGSATCGSRQRESWF
jgi:hypothetical protein